MAKKGSKKGGKASGNDENAPLLGDLSAAYNSVMLAEDTGSPMNSKYFPDSPVDGTPSTALTGVTDNSNKSLLLGDEKKKTDVAAATSPSGERVMVLSSPVWWLKRLSSMYSFQLLVMVFCTNHVLKGFVSGGGRGGMIGKPMEFLFAEYKMTASEIQMYGWVWGSPWWLKPLIGFVSDAFPIRGYKKMPYCVITTIFSLFAVTFIGATTHATMPLVALVACLFFWFLHVATCDLLVEAKQSEEVKEKTDGGSEFFQFTWMGITIGQALGIVMVGSIIQWYGPRWSYLLVVPLVALVLWPLWGNFLKEKPMPSGPGVGETGITPRKKYLWESHPELCYVTFLVAGSVICLNISVGFGLSTTSLFCIGLTLSAFVMGAIWWFLRPEIAKPLIFDFMLCLSYVNLEGALFYFYTDTPDKYTGGPHFSKFFYTAILGLVTFAGVFVGFTTGEALFKEFSSYQSIMRITVVARTFTLFWLVPFLWRGVVPEGYDKVYICAVLFIDAIICAWRWIPKQVLGAHLTPNGVEAVVLALVAGTYNMALLLWSYVGAGLMHFVGVQPKGAWGEDGEFWSLWQLQAAVALLPLLTLPLIPYLYPAATQTESILNVATDSATFGSPYQRRQQRLGGLPAP